jgi:hypothetical protein
LALRAKNRAFHYKSSEAPMRFLWAFRCNPLRGSVADQVIANGNYLGITDVYPRVTRHNIKTHGKNEPQSRKKEAKTY